MLISPPKVRRVVPKARGGNTTIEFINSVMRADLIRFGFPTCLFSFPSYDALKTNIRIKILNNISNIYILYRSTVV